MNSRERFLETMRFGSPDRVPYFEEGIRKEVLNAWRKQGCPPDFDLAQMFRAINARRSNWMWTRIPGPSAGPAPVRI